MWWQLPHHFEKKITPCVKISSRWIKDLELQNETIRVLRENMGKYFFNFVMWKAFLNMTQTEKLLRKMPKNINKAKKSTTKGKKKFLTISIVKELIF